MGYGFLDILATPAVRAVQTAMGTDGKWTDFKGHREFDRFGEAESAFIAAQDHMYMATVSESGWPYVQHRGGKPGFIKVIDETTLAFPDYRGNLQYISAGNLTADERVALILVDYPRRARIKILARAEIVTAAERPDVAKLVLDPTDKARVERIMILHLVTFDWNCPQHITPRFTEAEVGQAIKPLMDHVAALEAEVATLRAKLGQS